MIKKWILSTALLIASLSAQAENAPLHFNLVEFQEHASVSVPNDTMHMTLAINEQHSNRHTATQNTTHKLNALQNKLNKYNQLDIVLGNRSVYPQYNNKNQITHWQDNVVLHIKSTDFNAMSQIIADTEKEAMLRDVYFSVSPKKHAKAVEQASEKAINTIHERAAFLSKKLGFSGYNLVKVELHDSFEQNHKIAYSRKQAFALDAATPAASMMNVDAEHAGEEKISQNVRVTIQMK